MSKLTQYGELELAETNDLLEEIRRRFTAVCLICVADISEQRAEMWALIDGDTQKDLEHLQDCVSRVFVDEGDT